MKCGYKVQDVPRGLHRASSQMLPWPLQQRHPRLFPNAACINVGSWHKLSDIRVRGLTWSVKDGGEGR
jgi:hypothetical protein